MQVIRHTVDEIEFGEQASLWLLPFWMMMLLGIAMVVGLLNTTWTFSNIGLGILGLLSIYMLFTVRRTERCLIDKRLGKLVLKERWLLGLRVREYPLYGLEEWQIGPVNTRMHAVTCRLTSGEEVSLYSGDASQAAAFAEQVGMFLWGDRKGVRD